MLQGMGRHFPSSVRFVPAGYIVRDILQLANYLSEENKPMRTSHVKNTS